MFLESENCTNFNNPQAITQVKIQKQETFKYNVPICSIILRHVLCKCWSRGLAKTMLLLPGVFYQVGRGLSQFQISSNFHGKRIKMFVILNQFDWFSCFPISSIWPLHLPVPWQEFWNSFARHSLRPPPPVASTPRRSSRPREKEPTFALPGKISCPDA